MTGLRVIQTTSAGVDWILPLVPSGVVLCNARGVHDVPVAEWVVAVTLAMERNLHRLRDEQRACRWTSAVAEDIHGKTVLTLGHGSIGRALEARLASFGVRFLRIARRRRDGVGSLADLDQMLPQADVVVLLLPLTQETEGVVDASFLARMRKGALLVNAARGRLVVTDALVQALHEGRVRAALDVIDPEPLPPGHPLWTAPDVLITPHVAGVSSSLWERSFSLIGEQLRRYRAGEPLLNVVEDY
jgi:phosphoglycerate dehydrogenase-like enzyme